MMRQAEEEKEKKREGRPCVRPIESDTFDESEDTGTPKVMGVPDSTGSWFPLF